MKLSDGVEWGTHCVVLLASLPENTRLSGRALAQFHGVPDSYLLKHLNALTQAGILGSHSGPNGGYSLNRKAENISLLDIVFAIEGNASAFRCTDIRRKGPCAVDDPNAYPKPCGINRSMLRAEAAYRSALKKETISSLVEEFAASVDPRIAALGQEWLEKNVRNASK